MLLIASLRAPRENYLYIYSSDGTMTDPMLQAAIQEVAALETLWKRLCLHL